MDGGLVGGLPLDQRGADVAGMNRAEEVATAIGSRAWQVDLLDVGPLETLELSVDILNPVPTIARLVAADEDTVRDVIHAFNERGLAALDPQRGEVVQLDQR
ncbi:helix-turn-helix domain-containing protein [Pseudonocardia kujensis]|uniref:helix-turn-helix domain-containing protein n=1 Tax=Pseudonocardia kujensis TaxID=1128675 RepID=UPI001E35B053|nr:helix-turn-helix domain-containing protein [Pseudonocardia kujensis]MCE0764611.1 helix-turn-helix domain-containing protein [Pseudonocardia kujensis]